MPQIVKDVTPEEALRYAMLARRERLLAEEIQNLHGLPKAHAVNRLRGVRTQLHRLERQHLN